MTDVRVVSFNVNQFSKPGHEATDLVARMADADVVLCQETVNIDLVAFAATQPGWSAFQVRNGDNDGHANTGVLYRTALGPAEDTIDLFVGVTKGTRRRFLAGVKLGGVWYWALHLFPRRFRSGIPKQLSRAGFFVADHPGDHVGGMDKNQAAPAALEVATHLDWHGIDIDGFLTNVPLKALAEFPKGFSDHPGVHAVVTPTAPTAPEVPVTQPATTFSLKQLIAALRAAVARFKAKGQARRAKRAQAMLDAGKTPKKVAKPKPAPKPYAKTTRDGHTIDQLTNYALFAVEKRLKFTPGSLTVVQGSYNGGAGAVSASAGTHDGGGVIDLTAANWEEKVHALRAVGFAAWHRPFNWDNAGGGEHIHAVLVGNAKLSPSAARQVTQYRNHTNGLANFGADNTWHPNPIPTFHMPTTAQENI